MARPFLALAVMLLTLATERPSSADDTAFKKFSAEYREKLPKLMDRYVKNRKVETVVREYRTSHPVPNEPIGSKTAEYHVTAVSEGTNIRIESKNVSPTPHDRGLWVLLRPNDRVQVTKNKEKTGFVVSDHRPTSNNLSQAAAARDLSGLFLPLDNIATVLDEIDTQGESSARKWEIISVTSTTWGGHRVKAVRRRLEQLRGTNTSFSTTYLDLDHDLIFRGRESEGKSQEGEVRKFVSELSYTASPDGYPVPSKLESHRIMPNGARIPSRIVEVKEYSRYTPSPEEFTLAQFGLAEPALDAPERTPRRRYIWAFVVAGVVFALVAGALYWRWRRPTQSPTPTRSSV